MLTVVLGLAAAISYGSADFFGGLATRRTAIFAVAVPAQAIGFALVLAVLPFAGGAFSARAAIAGVLAGLCGGAGIGLLYQALAIGKMGVVSPITAVLAAAIPMAAGVLRGEHLTGLQSAGIAAALAAVILISLTTEEDGRLEITTLGVREAIASGVLLGGFYIFLAFAPHGSGVYPLFFARVASTSLLAAVAFAARKTIVPAHPAYGAIVVAGILDMVANGLYVAAAAAGFVSIAAVLTSLYPAATVILALFVLGERLRVWQTAGVALALAGVALISV